MTVEEAVALAARAHAGQMDKSGKPYIEHPVRVMTRLREERRLSAERLGRPELLEGEAARAELIAAVLHDVLEDTPVTAENLLARGCPPRAVEAVVALTRRPDEAYARFIARAAADPIARRVKRADIEDNADLTRLAALGRRLAARLAAKYDLALSELSQWERHWAVVDSQKGQPAGYYQYFFDARGLARQWRWREGGVERAFAWPERIHPTETGGCWLPTARDERPGVEVPSERAAAEAGALGVSLDAPRARDWTDEGAVVRFGRMPEIAAVLFQRLRSAQQRKPVS